MRWLLALGAAACSGMTPPAEGRSCAATELPVCADATRALVCRDAFWASKPCAGGCKAEGSRVVCAGAGDNCSTADAPTCADSSSALVCNNFRWVPRACAGGCSSSDAGVACASAGGACSPPGLLCADAVTALECVARAWRPLPCRGPGGCMRSGAVITCDIHGSLEGDACASTAQGVGLCTADGMGTLECRSGTFAKTNTCRTCREEMGIVICTP